MGFQLGDRQYVSKEQLKAELKEFLQNTSEGIIKDKIRIKQLHSLIVLHPYAERKIGSGILHFSVCCNKLGSGKSFVLVRKDGTEERFSYKACIDGKGMSQRLLVLEALRFSIRADMIYFRKTIALPTTCSVSGKRIEDGSQLHIDHKIPFSVLVHNFCLTYHIDLEKLQIIGKGETLRLVDKKIEHLFQRFHKENAILQPSLSTENIKKSNLIL